MENFQEQLETMYLEFYGIDLETIDECELNDISFAQDGWC